MSLESFWASLGTFTQFDPSVIYDPMNDRWVVVVAAEAFSPDSSILLAVSQTDDPTGTWFLFRHDVDAADHNWLTTPILGHNKDWIVVSGNAFAIFSTNFAAQIFVFSKTDLYGADLGGRPSFPMRLVD
jgi:hypothetical protein